MTRTYLDGRTETVGSVALGETVTVPAGQLTIAPGSGASGEAVTLQAQPNASIALDYAPEKGLAQEQIDDSE